MFTRKSRQDYRLSDTALLQLHDGDLAWNVIEPIWHLRNPADDQATLPPEWKHVTRGQLAVFSVTWVEREVLNGGFAQYFWNWGGIFYDSAVTAAATFQLAAVADLLKQAASVFEHGRPGIPRSACMHTMEELAKLHRDSIAEPYDDSAMAILNDSVFCGLNDQFYEWYGSGEEFYRAIASFVRKDPSQFFKIDASRAGEGSN